MPSPPTAPVSSLPPSKSLGTHLDVELQSLLHKWLTLLMFSSEGDVRVWRPIVGSEDPFCSSPEEELPAHHGTFNLPSAVDQI